MAIDSVTTNIREAKECEAGDASIEVGEEADDDDDDDEDGDDDDDDGDGDGDDEGEEDAFPLTIEIFTFMPWPQWPEVPHVKYLVPGLSNFTTSLPLLKELTGVLMSQFL